MPPGDPRVGRVQRSEYPAITASKSPTLGRRFLAKIPLGVMLVIVLAVIVAVGVGLFLAASAGSPSSGSTTSVVVLLGTHLPPPG